MCSTQEGRRDGLVMRVAAATTTGRVRGCNQDRFVIRELSRTSNHDEGKTHTLAVDRRGVLLCVCDGMGGAAAGEVASGLAVDFIANELSSAPPTFHRDELAARLVHVVDRAGRRIYHEANRRPGHQGMGTTATIAVHVDGYLLLAQIGDSRGYVLRGGRLVQVTRDQSITSELLESGVTEAQLAGATYTNMLTQALGTTEGADADLTKVDLRRNDTLLLCTDGLWGLLGGDELQTILQNGTDPWETCSTLTERAETAGGFDNITVIVARFDSGLPEPTELDVTQLARERHTWLSSERGQE